MLFEPKHTNVGWRWVHLQACWARKLGSGRWKREAVVQQIESNNVGRWNPRLKCVRPKVFPPVAVLLFLAGIKCVFWWYVQAAWPFALNRACPCVQYKPQQDSVVIYHPKLWETWTGWNSACYTSAGYSWTISVGMGILKWVRCVAKIPVFAFCWPHTDITSSSKNERGQFSVLTTFSELLCYFFLNFPPSYHRPWTTICLVWEGGKDNETLATWRSL